MYRNLRVRLMTIALLLAMAAISANLFTFNSSAAFAASNAAPGPTFTPTVPSVPPGCGKYGCPTATAAPYDRPVVITIHPLPIITPTAPPVPPGCGKYGCPTATPTVPPVPPGCGKYGCPTTTVAPFDRSTGNAAPGPTFTPTVPPVPPGCGKYGCPTATPVNELPACGPQSWITAMSGPQSLAGMGATSDGANVYFAGGYNLSSGIEASQRSESSQFARYNPNSNSWVTLADVPANGASDGQSLVYAPVNGLVNSGQPDRPGIEGMIFDFGGGSNVYTFGANGKSADGPVFRNTRIYNISTGQWSKGAPLPAARKLMASGYYQGEIYLAGGLDIGLDGLQIEPPTQLWVYDIASDSFESKAAMPGPVAAAGYGVINGHLLIAGGSGANGTALDSLYDYNIAADTWKVRANLPVALAAPGSAVMNGKLYLFGGMAADRAQSLTYIYDPATNLWSRGPSLNVARAYIGAATVNDNSIGGMISAYGGVVSGEVAQDTTTSANEVLQPLSPCP